LLCQLSRLIFFRIIISFKKWENHWNVQKRWKMKET
jgi:hypothetical protein